MITFDMEKIYIVSIHCLALPMISSGKNRGFPRGCDETKFLASLESKDSKGHDGKHFRVFS